MAEDSKIEWTRHTFNPWIGCTRVSPACDNCYAAELMDTRYGRAKWGAGEERKRTAASTWKQPYKWNNSVPLDAPWHERTVFCASLADVFDNEVDPAWRRDLFCLIRETPNLVWLLLTKRIGNAVKMMDEIGMGLPVNCALGATMADQAEWDRDARKLEEAAQALDPLFTFASVEPMLSPVIISDNPCPDWVIVGGESGKHARLMDPYWAGSLHLQVHDRRKAFFLKQMTKKAPIPDFLQVRQWPILRR